MNTFLSKVSAFVREEEGLTMIEYAIGAAVIAGAGVLIFNQIGLDVKSSVDATGTAVTGAKTTVVQ